MPNIHEAAEFNDCETLLSILDRKPTAVAERNPLGDLPLHTACSMKNFDAAQLLIQRGAPVNARGDYGRTPLHCAVCDSGDECIPTVQLLLDSGADPTLNDATGMSVLAFARQEQYDGFEQTQTLLKSAGGRRDLYVAILINDYDLAVDILGGPDAPTVQRLQELRIIAELHPGQHFSQLPNSGLPTELTADRRRFVNLIDSHLGQNFG